MSTKEKQEKIVYNIVAENPDGIRTEQVKIAAMYKGVSCADRYLRWLQERGLIYGERLEGDKTKTWKPVKNPVRIEYDEDLLWRKQQQEAAKDELFILKAMDDEKDKGLIKMIAAENKKEVV